MTAIVTLIGYTLAVFVVGGIAGWKLAMRRVDLQIESQQNERHRHRK